LFTVIYLTTINGVLTATPYGTFATADLARGWIAGQTNPGLYVLGTSWSQVAPPGGSALSPLAIAVGQWTALLIALDANFVYQVYCYGSFASQSLAQAYITSQGPGLTYTASQVVALP
jgi:hypothetical protein